MRRTAALVVVLVCGAAGLVGCDAPQSTVSRPSQPQVLTGARLPSLVGTPVDRIVGFRFTDIDDDPTWTQIPVQVDQRKVVPFGSQPPSNGTPGVAGTVYGHGSGGPTALQYADATTFVGADPNPAFDADDELVFMVDEAGGRPGDAVDDPAGVVAGSGVIVGLEDPQGEGQRGWVVLYRSTGGLDPAAGQDLVDYDFVLGSGTYKATYKRADGPNPETSRVSTATYEIGFSDRWTEHEWSIGGGTGVDVLDGVKNQFAVGNCGRSNVTFNDGEGAYVANVDGPVRAIRSYVGANSGPLSQRTHYFYRDREVTVTHLRVHPIPAIMDYVDLSAAAVGMTYRSSTVRSGVPVDGAADGLASTPPAWEAVTGPQGTVMTRMRFATNAPGVAAKLTWFTRDAATTSEPQCWGDASYYGTGGPFINGAIPNTDPRASGAYSLVGTRVTQFGPPAADGAALAAQADGWAADVHTPLAVTVTRRS